MQKREKDIKELEGKLDLEEKEEKIKELKAEIKLLKEQDLGFKIFETTPIWEDYDFESLNWIIKQNCLMKANSPKMTLKPCL